MLDQVVLKHHEVFVLCDARGDITTAPIGAGLYFRDMRHLSTASLALDGSRLELLKRDGDALEQQLVYLTNADVLEPPPGDPGSAVLPHTILLARRREIRGALIEQLTVTNHNAVPVCVTLRVVLGADFRDLFDIRGLFFQRERQPSLPRQVAGGYDLVYDSVDGTQYRSAVRIMPAPTDCEVQVGHGYTDQLTAIGTPLPGHDRIVHVPQTLPAPLLHCRHTLALGPHAAATLTYRIAPVVVEPDHASPAASPAQRVSRPIMPAAATADPIDAMATALTSNAAFNIVLDRSHRDLQALLTPLPSGGTVIAAGIPWFVAPFGRDSVIAARQLLPFQPGIAAATLRFLAATQGQVDDPWRDEQPGKIAHEIRFGEMARRNLVPHARYYGSVDATPLFLMLLADYLDWTDDRVLLNELWSQVERALAWIDTDGDANQDGLLDYERRSERGLGNQGWKDSDSALQRIDQQAIPGPIALVEVQGYVYAAKAGLATHLQRYGDHTRARQLRQQAEQLRVRIEDRFWIVDTASYAEAIDGAGARVTSIASNPAHLLACGVPSAARAAQLVERLFSAELFSGWGVRTLSTAMPHYNPVSYHTGSVWPHDNGFILWGLRRYRQFAGLDRLATALFEAATRLRDHRLPELLCGFARDPHVDDVPTVYPVSCSPQAWAAGVPFVMLESLLGLRADAAASALTLDPWLPAWLEWVEVRGIRVGEHHLDLRVSGRAEQVAIQILANPGQLTVTRATQ